jgi:UPF0176 protein
MAKNYPVILFYKYVPIADASEFVEVQRRLCVSLELKGRVLIAPEGINGTLAGPEAAVDSYVAALKADMRFEDIEIKVTPGDENTFPKLAVKLRPEIVTLSASSILPPDTANHLSPAEWKRMMEEDGDAVVVDVRNRFESAVGKFENAIVCDIGHFRELPDYVERLESLKTKKVLMYCTGGIRCEKASALFRSKGFEKVFQLHGGILTYKQQFGNEHWLGECFVFDQRMTVRVDEGLVRIGRCVHTGKPAVGFVNCLHDPCHELFLLAPEAALENPDYRLCPECLARGLTSSTAEMLEDFTAITS